MPLEATLQRLEEVMLGDRIPVNLPFPLREVHAGPISKVMKKVLLG
jgi:hypothetical protein